MHRIRRATDLRELFMALSGRSNAGSRALGHSATASAGRSLMQRLQSTVDMQRRNVPDAAADGVLPRSARSSGRFVLDPALFPEAGGELPDLEVRSFLKWLRGLRGKRVPLPSADELGRELPVLTPDASALTSPPRAKAQVTWLGHSSMLVQWEGWTVLADPIFSERCSAYQWIGPRRFRPAPLQVADLPAVDAVLLSHSHYDHLDYNTVTALAEQQPNAIFFVPLGLKEWFLGYGIENVVEMDWSETVTLDDTATDIGMASVATVERPPLSLTCAPAQHWAKRTMLDTNHTLWCSWVCATPRFSYYFGGDSGYCEAIFRSIGKLHGPFDLAAIPMGAYGLPEERWFHEPNHMDPAEAVQCHMALRSRQSVGIHWGTFKLTSECVLEPPLKLKAALAEHSIEPDEFVCLQHGESATFGLRGSPIAT